MDQAAANGREGHAQGLENHLRSLILTNAPSNTQSQDPPPQLAQPNNVNQSSPQTPKSGKRRPNQAQRRQMGSQFSIPVDTQHQQPVEHTRQFGYTGRGQEWRMPSHDQRHHHPESFRAGPNVMPHHHQGHWNSSQRRPPPGIAGIAPQTPHQHRGSTSMMYDAPPSFGWRHGPGPPPNRRSLFTPEEVSNQAAILDQLCFRVVSGSEIEHAEIVEKENFRTRIEHIIRKVITFHEAQQSQRTDFPSLSIELKCFGSLSSGFATKASDMDLALISPLSTMQPDDKASPIPRIVEKALLDSGIAARLLTRTRVPIIKLCENPPESLYQDLLAYREKWESGAGNDNPDEQDEDEDHDAPTGELNNPSEDKKLPKSPHHNEDERAGRIEFEVPALDGGEPQKLYLTQGSGTTLEGYYGLAKRVLRKAGGRDVKGATAISFSDLEWEILNRICEAYVCGLANPTLRARLEAYRSLSFKPMYNMPDRHSLMGVYAQIEGEHILQLWESSVFRTCAGPLEPQISQMIRTWTDLQNRPNYGVDPVAYSKDLQLALDRLKRIPLIQATLLEQGQPETPSQYHHRAAQIADECRGRSADAHGNLEQAFIKQYVQGIHTKDIRSSVQDEIDAVSERLSLASVARRHKSLQLAREFSRALDKDLFNVEHVQDIKSYVDLLKSPLRKSTKGYVNFDFVVPITKDTLELVSRIRTLPDPHLIAPKQAKDRYRDKLEFPKSGAGVQCDINFSAHLALQNTVLLRCYSHSDPRVRPMVLFIKHWAKVRGINSGYHGTLSSYGYVLMVLHYLVNVVQPFVCPNLQQLAPPPPPGLSPAEFEQAVMCRGYNVQFWRNEQEISHLASINQLNHNTESVGHLLRGFFEYFAQSGPMSTGYGRGFDWGRDVLSLRTQGGLLSKMDKGWTGAKTVYEPQGDATPKKSTPGSVADTEKTKPRNGGVDVKEVRLRYLFAIEDPFEVDHNVARTVTHNGIVSIRDEFRHAWAVIKASGDGNMGEDLLKDAIEEKETNQNSYAELLDDIHGPVVFDDVNDS